MSNGRRRSQATRGRRAGPRRVWATLALLSAAAAVAAVVAASLHRTGDAGPTPAPAGRCPHRAPSKAPTVTVLNGTSRTGKAASIAARLAKAGFHVLAVSDARAPVARSTISYRSGLPRAARAVAAALDLHAGAVRAAVRAAAPAADVVLVIGGDLR